MRASVLIWSTVSGAILGLFLDATLIGVALIVGAVVPALRIQSRWLAATTAVVLTIVLIAMTALGYLEGRLKAV